MQLLIEFCLKFFEWVLNYSALFVPMIHIFQELKVVSENFCLFLGFGQNLFRVCRHQSPTVFFFSNSNQTPLADSFHFSILPKSQSSTSFSMCLCFRCSRISFPHQTFLHLDHHLNLCFDVVGFEICLHLLGLPNLMPNPTGLCLGCPIQAYAGWGRRV